MMRWLLLGVALMASTAFAEIGRVSVIEGVAIRVPKGRPPETVRIGSGLAPGDTLQVAHGYLKLELIDGSVVMLAPGSTFTITHAEFAGLERKRFASFLKSGSMWTRVSKPHAQSQFEVETERAVAAVRGTTFRVDAEALVRVGKGKRRRVSVVRVTEGAVGVKPQPAVARTLKRRSTKKQLRVEGPGPSDLAVEEWEKISAALEANQQIAVGVAVWDQAEVDRAVQGDAFSKWVEKNQ